MMTFENRYKKLNDAQRQAVDTIDGPVMVIAGPGTGKTELLSMRTAAILQKTDTLPENILCLTFTDSGASAMRERLVSIIGKDAYKVAIHTFHSFGTEIINQNSEHFYRGAHFKPANDLSSYEIVRGIFESLDHTNPLASTMNGEYTFLRDTLTAISELKRSGLTSDELLKVLDAGDVTIAKVEAYLEPVFASRITKKTVEPLSDCLKKIRTIDDKIPMVGIPPLSLVIADSLEHAIDQSIESDSTKPITAWRNQWLKKNSTNKYILKSRERHEKLRALSYVYYQYLDRMQAANLYDFDDMILEVVHTMEVTKDLLYNLQEKYQYVMVDEFQDTNLAQMRILYNLLNNPVSEGKPNIMIVGDDDQAIYSFQGADVSNILNFRLQYPATTQIVLTKNYRSTQSILDNARSIITQGTDRLENLQPKLSKQLQANSSASSPSVKLYEAETVADERQWLVETIDKTISSGVSPGSVCVLTRRHYEISSVLPYFVRAGIKVSYERRDNALDLGPLRALDLFATTVLSLAEGRHGDFNALLPEFVAHPSWEIKPIDIWKLSRNAYDNRKPWIDVMLALDVFKPVADWLITRAATIKQEPLERALDYIIGILPENEPEDTRSPLFEYYFSNDTLNDSPEQYLTYLEALRSIRIKLREYRPETNHTLETFLEFIELHKRLGSSITIVRNDSLLREDAVHVMTAHRAKGLEFDNVYIIDAVDSIWGETARSRPRLISYPENLPLAPAGETSDERLRLFYVAATRAKKQLSISYSLHDDNHKDTLRAGFLTNETEPEKIPVAGSLDELIAAAEARWYDNLVSPIKDLKTLLAPMLESYKLSATDLNAFIDIINCGPERFLIQNLLRFPRSSSPAAAYGIAIHSVLQNTHSHLAATGKRRPLEDILNDYEQRLRDQNLGDRDFDYYLQKGSDTLSSFLNSHYGSFSKDQKVELRFAGQGVVLGEARLTGTLDLVDIDKKLSTLAITDYKTGKPSSSWSGKTDYEKLRLHKYKQQLMFYRLLVENSRDYSKMAISGGYLQFVEPDSSGNIFRLEAEYSEDEYESFKQLIAAVWQKITQLDLPNTGSYPQSYKGVIEFEKKLMGGEE